MKSRVELLLSAAAAKSEMQEPAMTKVTRPASVPQMIWAPEPPAWQACSCMMHTPCCMDPWAVRGPRTVGVPIMHRLAGAHAPGATVTSEDRRACGKKQLKKYVFCKKHISGKIFQNIFGEKMQTC
jgi:hypothetical protein